MKRDDVLQDIEQKLRALGYSDEKDLEILKKYYFHLTYYNKKNTNKQEKDELFVVHTISHFCIFKK